jgi:hypothetical protein
VAAFAGSNWELGISYLGPPFGGAGIQDVVIPHASSARALGDFALLRSVACALRANKKQQKSNQQRKKLDKILATTEESETDLPRLFRHNYAHLIGPIATYSSIYVAR